MPTNITLPAWPGALPLTPLLDAYSESFPSLISNVTTGNKSMIVRKTATRSQTMLSVSFNLTKEQAETFIGFFEDTLDGGAGRFTFTHPRTKEAIEVSFSPTQQEAFTLEPNGSMNYFKISMQLIVWS